MSQQLEISDIENNAVTRRKNPNIPRCLNIAFISVLMLIILSLVTYLSISKVHNGKNNTDFTNHICFPCEFKPTNTNNAVVIMKEENLCCLPSSERHDLPSRKSSETSSSISQASRLQDDKQSHRLFDETNKKAVAAHLYLNTTSCSLPSKVLLWTRKRNHSFVTSGLNYSESTGIITVIQQGIYYIYSQLTFNTYYRTRNSTRYDQIYQQIWLMRNTSEQSLMFWKQSVNNSREYMPSFLGGNFELNKGDEIYVIASDPSLLYDFYKSNFFGLHLV
ncbi:hypothetical protein ACJMK2_018029 [Sinanodonta woodiana]|uniref:THD domain-containing protein n=1 Tax=Sinanodonta woodiana TaxID=1069815 RepID=A0ABD3UC64_SINWO